MFTVNQFRIRVLRWMRSLIGLLERIGVDYSSFKRNEREMEWGYLIGRVLGKIEADYN